MPTIYLADLTHLSITVSNDSFPLNVGLVASHVRHQKLASDVEVFKYVDELVEVIKHKQPTILGLSNYAWNHELSVSVARYAKSFSKNIITVFGGPYISYNPDEQFEFLTKYRDVVDFYAMFEGESSFEQILRSALANDFDIEKMKSSPIKGVLHLGANYEPLPFSPIKRLQDLDSIPSPYLTGLFDKFFDDVLSPMIETHRGCPYSCTFCHEGHDIYRKVNRYSVERIQQEIEYIAYHVGDKVSNLLIADPNFGQFPTDVKLAETLNAVSETYGYPKWIFASTAKNNQKNLIEITDTLKSSTLPIWMSMQSMKEEVLANIKRRNISIDSMIEVQTAIGDTGRRTFSELIMCLPGETYESHRDSIIKLMKLKLGKIATYQLMLLEGSSMKEADNLQKEFGFTKKFRVLPRSFTDNPDIGMSFELEEIVVATDTMTFAEYLAARKLHLMTSIFYNGGTFKGYFDLLSEFELDYGEFLERLVVNFSLQPNILKLFNSYCKNTEEELFDSREEAVTFYSQKENFEKLFKEELGTNLLLGSTSIAMLRYGSELVDVADQSLLDVSSHVDIDERLISDLSRFHKLRFESFLDNDRLKKTTQGTFKYDIGRWSESDINIEKFKFEGEQPVEFYTPKEQFDIVDGYTNRWGNSPEAFAKALTRLWPSEILRAFRTI